MYVKPFSKKQKVKIKGKKGKHKNNKSTYYWRFVELGTAKQPGQRFLTKKHMMLKNISPYLHSLNH